MGTLLAILSGVLKLGNAIMKAMGDAKLREAGQTKEIARASLALLATLEKANAIDRALLDDELDPDWVRRVIERATLGEIPDPGHTTNDGGPENPPE